MNLLREFFNEERKRVIEPDAFFTQRVMARLDQRRSDRTAWDFGIWEAVPNSTRPVLALALILILCFVAAEVFIPQMPQHGVVESFLAPEQNPAESFLYSDTELPSRPVVMEQLIALEESQ
jgi:hypothetical protein